MCDVEDVLREATIEELVDALNDRQHDPFRLDLAKLNMFDFIEILEVSGCPGELLEPIKKWAFQPVPDKSMLEQWMATAIS